MVSHISANQISSCISLHNFNNELRTLTWLVDLVQANLQQHGTVMYTPAWYSLSKINPYQSEIDLTVQDQSLSSRSKHISISEINPYQSEIDLSVQDQSISIRSKHISLRSIPIPIPISISEINPYPYQHVWDQSLSIRSKHISLSEINPYPYQYVWDQSLSINQNISVYQRSILSLSIRSIHISLSEINSHQLGQSLLIWDQSLTVGDQSLSSMRSVPVKNETNPY